MSICKTTGVTKRFGELTAVDSVDFELDGGDVVGMIGPNGAGKTTFVNLLSGSLDPDSGQIYVHGEEVTGDSAHARARRGIARSFQIPQIYEGLTLLENIVASIVTREDSNLRIVRAFRNRESYREEARELLRRFNLADNADSPADKIPHGERKILDVAMSMALEPDVLILDEPTSGVASSEKANIMDLIIENVASPERGVLFVSHDMELIEKYAESALALDHGAILSQGSPSDVLNDPSVITRIRGEQ